MASHTQTLNAYHNMPEHHRVQELLLKIHPNKPAK
jgi:hypothetical protein